MKKQLTICLAIVSMMIPAVSLRGSDYGLTFSDPVKITDDARNYRMSRNANNQMAFDQSGTLHCVYWSGGFATNWKSPSYIYYNSWAKNTGWGNVQEIDDSEDDDGRHVGGRIPSLAIDKNDTVWVAWHDHRHCPLESPYNGINNIEIYCDKMVPGGDFLADDIRLTSTSADHYGDNGYVARIEAADQGDVSIIWYDFHVDGWISDIFMKSSDISGEFDSNFAMSSMQLTDSSQRDPRPPDTLKPAFDMADFVITEDGTRHIIWTEDFGGSIGNASSGDPIYYGTSSAAPSIISYEIIASHNDGYWCPPKITKGISGDLWVAYTKIDEFANRSVTLIHKDAASSSFGNTIDLPLSGNCKNADLEIDSQGMLHLTIATLSGADSTIKYVKYDPANSLILEELDVTKEAGKYVKPCIELTQDELPVILFGQYFGDYSDMNGEIWFADSYIDTPTFSSSWILYQ